MQLGEVLTPLGRVSKDVAFSSANRSIWQSLLGVLIKSKHFKRVGLCKEVSTLPAEFPILGSWLGGIPILGSWLGGTSGTFSLSCGETGLALLGHLTLGAGRHGPRIQVKYRHCPLALR